MDLERLKETIRTQRPLLVKMGISIIVVGVVFSYPLSWLIRIAIILSLLAIWRLVIMIRERPLYTRLKGKTIQEWFRTWGTGAGWIAMHVLWLFLIEGVNRPLFERLLWGDLARFYWSTHFVFLVVLGTWCSWGGTGARKMVTWFARLTLLGLLLFLVTFVLRDVYRIPVSIPMFGAPVNSVDCSPPGNYESSVASPYPGEYIVYVTPQGKNPDGSLKRFKVADVPAGIKAIEIAKLFGEVHVYGRDTVFKDGTIFAKVRSDDGNCELRPLPTKESPLFLMLGEKDAWQVASPGIIPVEVKKQTPLYVVLKSEEWGGGGLVSVNINFRS